MPTQTGSLTDVVAKAREMQATQRRWRHERGEDPGASWCGLPDWVKLSWFREAAAELGVQL
jgi:hypothetical protein